MKKVYIIENLDCANCAAKIEAKIKAHPAVEDASITFTTRQLRLTAEDPDSLVEELQTLARTVEADARIFPREHGHKHEHDDHHHHDHECGCGHDHHDHDHHHVHEEERHSHDHAGGLWPILVGAVLFVLGLLFEYLGLTPGAVLGIFIAAYGILGGEILLKAWKNLRRGLVLDENFLMSVASIGAFFIGNAPEGVGVMLFYRVGEYFEHRAVERSRSQIMEALDLRPELVQKLEGDKVVKIPAEEARPGDLLLVRPGDRIPLDGVVISGESRIDTAPITGEPVPRRAAPGDAVTSGCVNLSGRLTIRAEKALSESMVTRILDSVENAAASKPKIDRFITRFARIYTPVVVAGALAVAVIPSLVTGDWGYWVYTALTFLVMSCPCALVLSVPLAFFAGIGAGSRKGILFKGGQTMEALGRIKTVILDKTGTLTSGDFRVQEVQGGDELLSLCAGCEANSTHPIAESIRAAARAKNLPIPVPEEMEELAGQGIRAKVEGKTVLCGNEKLMQAFSVSCPTLTGEGTLVLVAVEGKYAGFIRISDTLKPGSEAAIRRLREKGLHTVMLTGDAAASARAVAGKAGIREVHAELLPHQKLERLQAIRTGKGAAMFVGDGINDAPVLAGADVGAAMGTGADAAIEAADLVFMTADPEAIPQALTIAAQTQAIAWQNVVFALAIKFAVMLLGLFGWASMWMAVFADSGVAMLCVLNSIRLLYKK